MTDFFLLTFLTRDILVLPCSRQNSQQLFKWMERLSQVEGEIEILKSTNVRQVRSVMMGVIPRPGRDPVVIIMEIPLYGPDITFRLAAQNIPAIQQRSTYKGIKCIAMTFFQESCQLSSKRRIFSLVLPSVIEPSRAGHRVPNLITLNLAQLNLTVSKPDAAYFSAAVSAAGRHQAWRLPKGSEAGDKTRDLT